jgi:hypothetical protein
MKLKSFQKYLEKRLTKEEIAEIDQQVDLEVKILRSLQSLISSSLDDYMEKNKVGFNELVKRLDSSPAHVAKMRRGEANLTLASLAHLFATLGKDLPLPAIITKSTKL